MRRRKGSKYKQRNFICSCCAVGHLNRLLSHELTEDRVLLGHCEFQGHRSYRVTGAQGLGPLVLGPLIDSELGVFGVFCAVVSRAEVQRGQSARRCSWTLTWWGV